MSKPLIVRWAWAGVGADVKIAGREAVTPVPKDVTASVEVCQEEPKEEPVYDIVLPNSTSYAHSIAGGGGVVIAQDFQ